MLALTGGQSLIIWCVILGFVVIFLAELVRWRLRGPDLGKSSSQRLMDEIRRHKE
jgi:hypothetical protein